MTKYQRTTGLCALVAYIAGGTSRHQPMGVGHMTVLQLCGPMGFCVLQWCHPMLVLAKRTNYCTRMITLYGARKWIQARALHTAHQLLKYAHDLVVTYLLINTAHFLDGVFGCVLSRDVILKKGGHQSFLWGH